MKTISRKTIEIDAAGKAVGRVASEVAMVLMGKHMSSFERNIDRGDSVIVSNASKVKFTGRKLVQKDYYHHTMRPGGLKKVAMKHVFDADPTEIIRRAVNGMLPKNKFRGEMLKRLTIKA